MPIACHLLPITYEISFLLQGNPDVHVILRGGSKGPNYAAEYVRDCGEKLLKAGLAPKIMVRAYLNFRDQLDSSRTCALRRLIAATGIVQNSTNDKLTLRKIS